MILVPHNGWLSHVSARTILFEHGGVQIQTDIIGLKIQGDHLYTKRPKYDWIEIGRIDSHTSGIRSYDLRFRMTEDVRWLFATDFFRVILVQGGTLKTSRYPTGRSKQID